MKSRASSAARYRRHAAGYDATTRRTEPIRERAIALLSLRAGDTVVDAGCGTGLSFASIEAAIGLAGKLIGIEQSPEMLALARDRVARAGWRNVTLLESPAEHAAIPSSFDAVLFHFAHDIVRSRAALENTFCMARPGARVASAGMKYLPWWLAPANLYVLLKMLPYAATREGLRRPWSRLEEYLGPMHVDAAFLGAVYLASGTCPR